MSRKTAIGLWVTAAPTAWALKVWPFRVWPFRPCTPDAEAPQHLSWCGDSLEDIIAVSVLTRNLRGHLAPMKGNTTWELLWLQGTNHVLVSRSTKAIGKSSRCAGQDILSQIPWQYFSRTPQATFPPSLVSSPSWGFGAIPDNLTAIPDTFTSSTGDNWLGTGRLLFLTLLFESEAYIRNNLLQVSTGRNIQRRAKITQAASCLLRPGFVL